MSSGLRPSQRPRGPDRLHSSSSSLIDRGMEISVAPGQLAPPGSSSKHRSKELPPLPPNDEYYQEIIASRRSREYNAPQKFLHTSASYEFKDDVSQPVTEQRPSSLPPKSPSIPPMTKSSHKILQLTGFDPRFEKTFPEAHQQPPVSPVSDTSSGSVYSQLQGTPDREDVSRFSSWGSEQAAASQLRGKTGEQYLRAENYSPGDPGNSSHSSLSSNRLSPLSRPEAPPFIPQRRARPPLNNPSEPLTSYRYRDRSPKTLKNGRVLPLAQTSDPDLEEMTTLRELLEEEQWKAESGTTDLYTQYHREFTESELDTPVPKPLVLRNKKPSLPKVKSPKRTSLLTQVKENFSMGINEITSPTKSKHFVVPSWQAISPSKSKHPNTPTTPHTRFALDDNEESPNEGPSPLTPLKSKRRIFGSGKHPLKSPFPFSNFVESSDSEDAEMESPSNQRPEGKGFSKRLSGAMKRVSGSSRNPPIRSTSMIQNNQRDVSGPDTPLPTKVGFNDHIQGVYQTAKKTLNIKSSDEKNREELKKKIVVIGVTDQGPGMKPYSRNSR